MAEKKELNIFAYSVEPNGISGGETILIEIFKRVTKDFSKITINTWQPGRDLYEKQGLNNVSYNISKIPLFGNFYLSFITRVLFGIYLGLTFKLSDKATHYLYPSSDFWTESIPVILLKLRYPKAKLIANLYLTAPNPFVGFSENGGFKFPTVNNIFYFLMQQPIKVIYSNIADMMVVTSDPDLQKFPKHLEKDRSIAIRGGVDVTSIDKFKKNNPLKGKKYDAVFMGRFHPQKAVLELVSIWKDVVSKKPSAKLIMIGDGPLMPQVREKVKKLKLTKNIELPGYILEPDARFKIFSQSKTVLHPAGYDSGGMAAAEAMAFSLPAVSYDLEALKTYYPKGMIKTKIGDQKAFSKNILMLLENKKEYEKMSSEAYNLIKTQWNWDKRAKLFYDKVLSL